jgi:hypothetical protein
MADMDVYGRVQIIGANGDLSLGISNCGLGLNGQDVKIVNGRGNATLSIEDATFGKNFMYTQAPGDMMALIHNIDVAGNAQLKSNNGNDGIAVDTVGVGGKLMIMTGNGNLDLDVDGVVSGFSGRGGDAKIANGRGNAMIEISNADFGRSLSVSNAKGNAYSEINGIHVTKDYRFKGNGGENEVWLVGSLISGKTSIKTGNAWDGVSIEGSEFAGALMINTGGDGDEVYLDAYDDDPLYPQSIFHDPVKVILGAGDDYLGAGVNGVNDSTVFEGKVFVNGGSGYDVLEYETGDNIFVIEPYGVGFEDIY